MPSNSNWLARYANAYHTWTPHPPPPHNDPSNPPPHRQPRAYFARPLGLVEVSFDADGVLYGGRADLSALLTLRIRTSISPSALRALIERAWALLSLRHLLLKSHTCGGEIRETDREFVVAVPNSIEDAVHEAAASVVWVEESYPNADPQALFAHVFSSTRVLDPTQRLSKLFVLPLQPHPSNDGTQILTFLPVLAHQIVDGLSAYAWFSDFLRILNLPLPTLNADLSAAINPDEIRQRLPSAQEDLYPPIPGNRARQRWFWAILRVLRYVKRGLPPSFVNPLRRDERAPFTPLPQLFPRILDYSAPTQPPLNAGHTTATLSPAASSRLIALCREAKVSVGAGCFALVGMAMMAVHEAQHPHTPAAQRPGYGASFPLNPRAFFPCATETPVPNESCMLAFSQGFVLPFLPSHLPVAGRFRLLAKQANRELRAYQKRLKDHGSARAGSLERHAPSRLLAEGYVAQIERVEMLLPESRKMDVAPQGELVPPRPTHFSTNGVSSVGSIAAFFREGQYDVAGVPEGQDLVADYLGWKVGVRARENEFLVGARTNADGVVAFGVSLDDSAMDEARVDEWRRFIEGMLDKAGEARL